MINNSVHYDIHKYLRCFRALLWTFKRLSPAGEHLCVEVTIHKYFEYTFWLIYNQNFMFCAVIFKFNVVKGGQHIDSLPLVE